MLKKILATCIFGFITFPALATTLFYEDFETDLGDWTGKGGGSHNGLIVGDPLEADNALTFSSLNSAGDIFSTGALFGAGGAGTYTLEFDYLGTCGHSNCGGFIGFSYGLPGSHTWIGGTTSPYPDLLPDTGLWEHVSISFTAVSPFHIMIEDWIGSGGIAGDAFFDNIHLYDAGGPSTAVSSPSTFLLSLLAMVGLGLRARKQL